MISEPPRSGDFCQSGASLEDEISARMLLNRKLGFGAKYFWMSWFHWQECFLLQFFDEQYILRSKIGSKDYGLK